MIRLRSVVLAVLVALPLGLLAVDAAGEDPIIPLLAGTSTDTTTDTSTDTSSTGPSTFERTRDENLKKLFIGVFIIAAVALIGWAIAVYWGAIVAAANASWAALTATGQAAGWSASQQASAAYLTKLLAEWVKTNVK